MNVCLIPSRYQSKRFPGKALAAIDGIPMIQRVYDRVKTARGVDYVGVATDDDRIFALINELDGNVILTDPDLPTGTDRIAAAADAMALGPSDIVVNIQGDQPYICAGHIEQVIELLSADPGVVMATLAFPIMDVREAYDRNTVKVVMGDDGSAVYFSRAPIPTRRNGNQVEYLKHLGIYGFRRWFLEKFAIQPQSALEIAESLEQLRVIELGGRIRVGIAAADSISVDVPSDIERAQATSPEHGGCCG